MYQLVVFLHVLAGFIFFMAHGASFTVAFKLRGERELERIKALLELSTYSLTVMYIALLVLLAAGVIAGFMGNWWGRLWIWVALGLLIVIAVAMYYLGSAYYSRLRKLAGLPYFEGSKEQLPLPPASPQEISKFIETSRTRAWLIATIGVGGLAVILWLMMFKPF